MRFNKAIDKLILFLLLPLICPLSFYVYLLIRREGYSPIFKQSRIGKNKLPFTLYKFRSMKPYTPETLTHESSEENYLKCADFIRRFKLDEIPQLINVFNGTMSLIGPRPGLVQDYGLISEREKRDLYKFLPGITGYSQIMNVCMDDPIKLSEYDLKTIKLKKNILSYCLILVATVFPSQSKIKRIIVSKLQKF